MGLTKIITIFIAVAALATQTAWSCEEEPHSYMSYNKLTYCNASSPILYPESVEELQEIIRHAIATNNTVKVIGSRHSTTDVICTEGIPIRTHFFNWVRMNDDNTATIGSGVELKDAMEALHFAGRTLIHMPTFGGITVGGAIGTGAHGSSLKHPSALSDQLVSVTLVDGTGTLRTITRGDGEDFQAVGVHLGLLGAVVEITVNTVPLFKMSVHNFPDSEAILLDGRALAEAREYDMYQVWWFPSSESVVVSRGNYTEASTPGDAVSNLIPTVDAVSSAIGRFGFELIQSDPRLRAGAYALEEYTKMSLYSQVIGKLPVIQENGTLANPGTGYVHRLLQNRCHPCAWDNLGVLPEESAFAFDANELANVVASIKEILASLPAPFPMIGMYLRFGRASNNFMAIETGRDTVHLETITSMRWDPFNQSRDGSAGISAVLQSMLKDHNGRPHWGKNGGYYFKKEVIQSRVPHLYSFTAAMKKYDPNGIFLNKFGRRLLLQSDELDTDPRVTHCALQDYCLCEDNSDCADLQRCVKEFGGKYSVCKTTDPEIPPPEGGKSLSGFDPRNFTSIINAIQRLAAELV